MTMKTISFYQPQLRFLKERKIFDFPLPKWCLIFCFSLTLIVLFIFSDTFHLKLFCLVILLILVFTFPFLVTEYQLGHRWMCFVLDFRSLCRSFCRKKKKANKEDVLITLLERSCIFVVNIRWIYIGIISRSTIWAKQYQHM